MKIRRFEIREPLTVKVCGTEPWLSQIYASFVVPQGKEKPLITATLIVSVISGEFVRAKGSIEYRPWLACSRCADMIQWDVNASVDAIFQPVREGVASKGEHSLSRAELDEYYFDDDMIDLEILINDSIFLEIPDQIVPCNRDGSKCLECGRDLTSELVYGPTDEVRDNPFAALLAPKKK